MEQILVIRGTGEGRGMAVKKGSRWAMLTPAATEGSKCISDTGDLETWPRTTSPGASPAQAPSKLLGTMLDKRNDCQPLPTNLQRDEVNCLHLPEVVISLSHLVGDFE